MSVPKKVLGIVGSPRRGGNTEILVDEVLAGSEELEALTEKVILNELTIAPCQFCDTCQKTGTCIQQDDMVKLNEQLEASELWVLGTPVYMWGPTAQFKIFIDRWYGLKPAFFEGKSAILTVPFQGRHENFARYLVGMVSAVLSDFKIELLGTLLVPGITTKGAVRVKRDVLAEARRMGREAIQLLS